MLFLGAAAKIPLVTFDGADGTTFKFVELNDPVMGGQSTGTWTLNSDGYGTMDGEVVNVPSLSAPGFIKAAADGKFADVSSAFGGSLVLTIRSPSTSYTGYRVSFASGTLSPSYACAGGSSLPFSGGCYKTKFAIPASASTGFVDVAIPFANFSDHWSPATGEQTKTCAEDKSVCPSAKELQSISRIEIWGEGVNGKITVDVHSISALPPAAAHGLRLADSGTRPPKKYDTCSGPVQSGLKYGISGRTTPTVPIPVDPTESLATAICCDARTALFAEPQFLYQAPDIALFDKMSTDGVTTFYDSVSGKPLFKAPVGRSLKDFQDDTDEHGWPSFRAEEVFTENVVTNKTSSLVYSSTGTHLGSYLPDEQGPRWCMDLSCIAGNEE